MQNTGNVSQNCTEYGTMLLSLYSTCKKIVVRMQTIMVYLPKPIKYGVSGRSFSISVLVAEG